MTVNNVAVYKYRVFAITFLAYACFHVTRKIPSVLKNVFHPLHKSCNSDTAYAGYPGWSPFNEDVDPTVISLAGYLVANGIEGSPGDYLCSDTGNQAICGEYRNSDKHGFNASRKTYELVKIPSFDSKYRDTACPDLWKTCWLITKANDGGDIEILYAQNSSGVIPCPTSQCKDSSCVTWMRNEASSEQLVSDRRIIVTPAVPDGGLLLGLLDSTFLSVYTIGVFISGFLADRYDRRYFLTIGMVGSSLCMVFLGLAEVLQVHSLSYFLFFHALFGMFQSVGWPTVIGIMGSWFGESNRGLILAVWNSNIYVGNILGAVFAAAALHLGMQTEPQSWALVFFGAALFMLIGAGIVIFFLTPYPEDTGPTTFSNSFSRLYSVSNDSRSESIGDSTSALSDEDQDICLSEQDSCCEGELENDSVGIDQLEKPGFATAFAMAFRIPGVVQYSLSFFFCKMCSYSVLYWGPYYLASLGFSSEEAAYLCSFFDVGGILGSVVTGYVSDRLKGRYGIVIISFQLVGILLLGSYNHVANVFGPVAAPNIVLMILLGFFINAPYTLITTAVSTDLGTKIRGNPFLLSTVTGIIDSAGSLGAMTQGVGIGLIYTTNWANVWYLLTFSQFFSACMIVRIVYNEMTDLFDLKRDRVL